MSQDKPTGLSAEGKENTEVEIWRERPDDYYSDSIAVDGKMVVLKVAGHCIGKSLKSWHDLDDSLRVETAAREKAERALQSNAQTRQYYSDELEKSRRELHGLRVQSAEVVKALQAKLFALQEKVKGVPHIGWTDSAHLVWVKNQDAPIHSETDCRHHGACRFLEPETPEPSDSGPDHEAARVWAMAYTTSNPKGKSDDWNADETANLARAYLALCKPETP